MPCSGTGWRPASSSRPRSRVPPTGAQGFRELVDDIEDTVGYRPEVRFDGDMLVSAKSFASKAEALAAL